MCIWEESWCLYWVSLCLDSLLAQCCHQHHPCSQKFPLSAADSQAGICWLEFALVPSILCAHGAPLQHQALGLLSSFFVVILFFTSWCFNALKVVIFGSARAGRGCADVPRIVAVFQVLVKKGTPDSSDWCKMGIWCGKACWSLVH